MSTGTQAQGELRPRDIVKSDDPSTWNLAWTQGVTPWDAGGVQPSLIEVVEQSGLSLPTSGRALVPGCGTGYDVVYLSKKLGLETVGLDVAQTAIEVANKFIASNDAPKASVRQEDFFNSSDLGIYDLIYDHTFFCAIPPTLRPKWGERMAQLIKQGGYLVTSVYPMIPFEEGGPPYYIRPEHQAELLEGNFEKVFDKDPSSPSPSHEGKERIVVWRHK